MDLEYKDEIISSHKGGLGGSDASMVFRIGKNEAINNTSDKERIATLKGLYDKPQFKNEAMEYGDFIENEIFKMMAEKEDKKGNMIFGNPLYIYEKYKDKFNFDVFCHIDIEIVGDKFLVWYEVKASKKSLEDTFKDYREQLFWEWIGLKEKAKTLGLKPKLYLLHYDANEKYDSNGVFVFDKKKISRMGVSFMSKNEYPMDKGLEIINNELVKMDNYSMPEIIEWDYLPPKKQEEFKNIYNYMLDIEKQEQRIADFKNKMYDFLVKNNIKSIKNPYFILTRVDESTSKTFDSKQFKREKPDEYDRYIKINTKKGYAQLKLKSTNEIETLNQ